MSLHMYSKVICILSISWSLFILNFGYCYLRVYDLCFHCQSVFMLYIYQVDASHICRVCLEYNHIPCTNHILCTNRMPCIRFVCSQALRTLYALYATWYMPCMHCILCMRLVRTLYALKLSGTLWSLTYVFYMTLFLVYALSTTLCLLYDHMPSIPCMCLVHALVILPCVYMHMTHALCPCIWQYTLYPSYMPLIFSFVCICIWSCSLYSLYMTVCLYPLWCPFICLRYPALFLVCLIFCDPWGCMCMLHI